MRNLGVVALVAAGCVAALVGMSSPDVKVEIKGVHLCCGGCNGAATGALKGAGAKEATADQAGGTITFTAANEKNALKALEAFAAAGFHGDTGNKLLAVPENSGANPTPNAKNPKAVTVTSITLKGAHNCCGGCTKGIKAALMKIDGYESDDLKDKAPSFTIKGKLDPINVIKCLNEGGYHAKVESVNK